MIKKKNTNIKIKFLKKKLKQKIYPPFQRVDQNLVKLLNVNRDIYDYLSKW